MYYQVYMPHTPHQLFDVSADKMPEAIVASFEDLLFYESVLAQLITECPAGCNSAHLKPVDNIYSNSITISNPTLGMDQYFQSLCAMQDVMLHICTLQRQAFLNYHQSFGLTFDIGFRLGIPFAKTNQFSDYSDKIIQKIKTEFEASYTVGWGSGALPDIAILIRFLIGQQNLFGQLLALFKDLSLNRELLAVQHQSITACHQEITSKQLEQISILHLYPQTNASVRSQGNMSIDTPLSSKRGFEDEFNHTFGSDARKRPNR